VSDLTEKKNRVQLIANTALGGALFLLPIVVLIVILGKAISLMMVVAQPMADWLPIDSIGGVALANIIALVVIILLCFIGGLVARHALAGKFVGQLESKVLVNVPGYMMIKNLVHGFDKDRVSGLKPVVLTLGTAERFGFEIQKLPDGRSVVFIPSVPSAFSGVTQVLPPEQVTYLDVPVSKIIEITENFGHGAEKLLAEKKE
jgi:uncharacterized membrane protein